MSVATIGCLWNSSSTSNATSELVPLVTQQVLGVGAKRQSTDTGMAPPNPHHRIRQAVNANGRPALTHYEGVREVGKFSFLKIRLETGRMHQIRAHLSNAGLPVFGDTLYGSKKSYPIR